MSQKRHVIHGRDHEHGAADPIRIAYEDVGDSGGGITGNPVLFDVEAQTGGFVRLGTTAADSSNSGFRVDVTGPHNIVFTNPAGTFQAQAVDVQIVSYPGGTVSIALGTGGHLMITGLPTSAPGAGYPGAIWVDGSGYLRKTPG